MAESKDQTQQRESRELEGKNVAHYSVLLSAWIETKMQRDKTLVTLSAAAIGLLVTLLATVGVNSAWEILLFVIAVVCFLVTIGSSLAIYQLNSQHIEKAIRGSSKKDPKLKKYDKCSIIAFVFGSVFALLIGILSASSSLQPIKSEENIMSDKKGSTQNAGKPSTLKGSLNGITGLKPSATVQKSLDGITNLNPQPAQQTSQSQNQTQGSTTNQSNSTSTNNDSGKK